MSYFVVTIKIEPPNDKVKQRDIQHFIEAAIGEFGGHLRNPNHPLHELEDDDIRVTVKKVKG